MSDLPESTKAADEDALRAANDGFVAGTYFALRG
jgi:hypothetical protein